MLRIVDEIPAWLPGNNRFQSLTQAPKHHLADPALAARISGMTIKKLISSGGTKGALPIDGTFLGALFESLVTLTVRVFAQNYNAQVFHLRTREGRQEVDLIIESELSSHFLSLVYKGFESKLICGAVGLSMGEAWSPLVGSFFLGNF